MRKSIRLSWIARKKLVFAYILIAAAYFIYFSPVAFAQPITSPNSSLQEGVQVLEQPLGLPSADIRVIVAQIIRVALGLLGIVLVAINLYGGFLWMTAAGNEEQIEKAKKLLVNGVIGLVIVLSAFAIVSFILSSLVAGTAGTGGNEGAAGEAPAMENFSGSGALGAIIKDHYPARDQINIPRNTKIIVVFKKPVKPDSFMEDTNADGKFGNCLEKDNLNWNTDCDKVKLSDDFVNIKRSDTGEPVYGAAGLAQLSVVNNVTGIYTLIIKPLADNSPAGGRLGSNTEPVKYTVHLGPGIRLDDPANSNPSAFEVKVLGNDYYEWEYAYGASDDTVPPKVESVFPMKGTTETKNTVIQINFSEPVDPTGLQGMFSPYAGEANVYSLPADYVFLNLKNSKMPVGGFTLTNGYKTLEFVSTVECGKNACGNSIYCLPVCDQAGASCSLDNYSFLLKAARTINASSFEAVPFTGIADLAGNALDGNNDGKVNAAPAGYPVFPTRLQPDNYFWNFNINQNIDATAPYITAIKPDRDASGIAAEQEWSMTFSKRMRADSMYSIGLEEKPGHAIPLWKFPSAIFNSDGTTYVRMYHGPFLDQARQYYFPIVTSDVEDIHYNCFYPGRGPGCEVIDDQNKAFCCNGSLSETNNNADACLQLLKSETYSPP